VAGIAVETPNKALQPTPESDPAHLAAHLNIGAAELGR